jgi:hypothetical protein
MRNFMILMIAIFPFVASERTLAQEDTVGRVGIGISLDPTRKELVYTQSTYRNVSTDPEVSSTAVSFYVPLNVAPHLRLEPNIGIALYKSAITYNYPLSTEQDQTDESIIIAGIRGLYIIPVSSSVSFYAGPKIELNFVSSTDDYWYLSSGYPKQGYKTVTTETDVTVGGVFGVEYFPVHALSIGGEVSINYLSYGNPDETTTEYSGVSSGSGNSTNRDQYCVYTGALFFLRWYFL